ncbi:MAG: hypothetical protein RIB65_18615 [Ilumatobacter fluminis]|uniref:HEPN domain-containing protein n=1 Tax=Ilumatobacter fluminis TaxID=467091 RepID=UPI0032ECA75C
MTGKLPWSQPFEVHGSWWVENARERVAVGTLRYLPTDGLSLHTSDGPQLVALDESPESATLNGLVDGEYWTLGGCWATSSGSDGHTYVVGLAVRGVGMSTAELEQLDELRLSFHELRYLTGIAPRRNDESALDDLVADIGDGWTLGLESIRTREASNPDEIHYSDRLEFVVRSPRPGSLYELADRTYRTIVELSGLFAQRSVSLQQARVAGEGSTVEWRSGRTVRHVCDVYWPVLPAPSVLSDPPKNYPLSCLPATQKEFGDRWSAWFGTHRSLDLVFALRFADLTVDFGYAEPRFMMAMQTIEALHRRLRPDSVHTASIEAREEALASVSEANRAALKMRLQFAHEPTLRQRLRELINDAEPFASELLGDQLKPFVHQAVAARNAVTHLSPDVEHPSGLLLMALQRAASALTDLVLLRRLGFDDEGLRVAVRRIGASSSPQYWLHRALSES